jgi:hypothetical protein
LRHSREATARHSGVSRYAGEAEGGAAAATSAPSELRRARRPRRANSDAHDVRARANPDAHDVRAEPTPTRTTSPPSQPDAHDVPAELPPGAEDMAIRCSRVPVLLVS